MTAASPWHASNPQRRMAVIDLNAPVLGRQHIILLRYTTPLTDGFMSNYFTQVDDSSWSGCELKRDGVATFTFSSMCVHLV